MKQRRTATGFLQSWLSLPYLIISESHELYIAVHAIEWQFSQCLEQVDTMNWDQVMDHFLKVCKWFV